MLLLEIIKGTKLIYWVSLKKIHPTRTTFNYIANTKLLNAANVCVKKKNSNSSGTNCVAGSTSCATCQNPLGHRS